MWIRIDGAKLRDIRSAKGMTAAILSDKSGVAESTIVDLEQGKRDRALEKSWMKIAAALDVRPSELEKKEPAAPAQGSEGPGAVAS